VSKTRIEGSVGSAGWWRTPVVVIVCGCLIALITYGLRTSFGQFVFAPVGQAFISSYGWATALLLLACFGATVPVLAAALRSDAGEATSSGSVGLPAREAVREAFGHGSYLLLMAGFFVCGFHVAFITTHLPAHLSDAAAYSHAHGTHTGPELAAWALALIGLFNVLGSYGSGILGAG
jgi:hypothetical protein